jgi:hypothetical protein
MKVNLKSVTSAGLLALLSAAWMPLSAQVASPATEAPKKDEKPVVIETLVVSGLRASLGSAADIKKSNLQLVDSIVASDIDKLPDINASYALSRARGPAGPAVRGPRAK